MLRSAPFRTLCLALLLLELGAGCAGGPKYGAARKRRKGCDCPHWNAVPRKEQVASVSCLHIGAPTAEHGVRN
ncbi:MAG: hypothetical protein U0U25_06135 [Flavobacteriales bacterium]